LSFAKSQKNILVPYYDASKQLWGFADYNHKIIVSPKYNRVDDFTDGLAWVEWKDKCGFVDTKGKEVIAPIFQSAESFYGGYSVVQVKESTGVIDKNGNYIVPLGANSIGWFNGEVGRIEKSYSYGLIGKGGKLVLPIEYSNIEKLTEHLFIFSKQENKGDLMLGKMGLINSKGKIVLQKKYDLIYPITDGFATIKLNNRWGLMDSTGKVILPPIYEEIRNPKAEGLVGFKKGDKWGIIKFDGTILVNPIYDALGNGNSNFDEQIDKNLKAFKVYYKGNYGMIDFNGKEKIPIKYYMLGYLADGVLTAYRTIDTSKSGLPITGLTFINEQGVELIAPMKNYNLVGMYSEGLIAIGFGVQTLSKWIYVDSTAKQMIPGEFEEAEPFHQGAAIVKKAGKYGVIDKMGKEKIPIRYSEIARDDNYPTLFKIKVNGEKVYYDTNGQCFCKEN
jgi:hypothetical protein